MDKQVRSSIFKCMGWNDEQQNNYSYFIVKGGGWFELSPFALLYPI